MKESSGKLMKMLATNKLFSFPRQLVWKFILKSVTAKNGDVVFYPDPEILKAVELTKQIKSEQEMLLAEVEAYQIYMTVKRTAAIKGDIAEVGVFKGSSAKLICEAKGEKTLHLFDTFEGLPEVGEFDDTKEFWKGRFEVLFDNVKNYLKAYPNVYFYKGLFPDTAGPVTNKNFSFVHLDVDLYECTLNCLKFFYPRMSKGGIIISHDYHQPGVKKAFEEFFADKPEQPIELPLYTFRPCAQCLMIKR